MSEINIPEPVASFFAHVNAHDKQAFLNAFVDGGFVDDWGRVFNGRDEIEGWSDVEFIGSKPTFTPEEVSNDGDEVTVTGDWRSNHANGRSKFVFQVQGTKLQSMTISAG